MALDQNFLRLEVSVTNTFAVQVFEPVYELLDNVASVLFAEVVFSDKRIDQVSRAHVLHHYVKVFSTFQHLKHACDARVINLLQNLILKALQLFVDIAALL